MKRSMMQLLIASLAISGSTMAQEPGEERGKLAFTISAGVFTAPSYRGDDHNQTSAIPNISLSYGDRFKASLRGIEYLAFSARGWQAGTLLSYDTGRDDPPDDNPFMISGDSSTDLIGLGGISSTVELGGFVAYQTGPIALKVEMKQGVDGGHDGLVGQASASFKGRLSGRIRPVFLSVGPAITFGDGAFNSTFFDVSEDQSAASGISQFDASGGLNSIGLHASVFMPLTRKVSLVGFANYDQLTGDVGKSSIVSERGSKDQLATGVFLSYRF